MSDLQQYKRQVYWWMVAFLIGMAAILLVARCIPTNAVSTIFK